MDNKILQVGLIGAGRIGKMHATNIANNFPEVKLKSIADPSIDKELIESLKIENCYTNPDRIINDDKIHAVIITSPTPTHINYINKCAKNNKHIFCEKPIALTVNEIKKVIDINLTSTFLMSKYSIKKMLKNKFGRVVNVTSIVGHSGNLGQSNYAASKAGIIGMSKSLAIEYAKKNITINCVSPGFIVSDMTMNIAEKVKLYLTSRIPMGKLGTGEDVSNSVAFLSSEQASYITGETIHVNGGMYMA